MYSTHCNQYLLETKNFVYSRVLFNSKKCELPSSIAILLKSREAKQAKKRAKRASELRLLNTHCSFSISFLKDKSCEGVLGRCVGVQEMVVW